MKYSITISDMSYRQACDVLEEVNARSGGVDIKQPPEIVAATGVQPIGSPAPLPTPEQATMAAAVEAGIVPPAAVPQLSTTPDAAVPAAPVGIIAKAEAAEAAEMVDEAPPFETDNDCLPWDARIHSSSKKQTKKGVWSKRKNLEAGVYEAVTAELKQALMVATVPGVVVDKPDAGLDVGAFMERNNLAAPGAIPAAPAVPPAPALPAAAPVAAPPARDFNGFMQQVQNLFAAGDIDEAYMTTNVVGRINADFTDQPDIVGMTDIAHNEAMVDYAWKCLEADQKIGVA